MTATLPPRPWLALVGPTASGKSEAALGIASRLPAEVVSVDSMLVYRGMDIGTAKPSEGQRAAVPHHLIDVADPEEPFSVSRYQALVREALEGIGSRGRRALFVGGSGLYFRAAVDGLQLPPTDAAVRLELEAEAVAVGPAPLFERLRTLDPVAAGKIEPANIRRTVRALEVAAVTGRTFSSYAVAWDRYPAGRVRAAGVWLHPDVLRRRIEARVGGMIESGLVGEVRRLMARGLGRFLTASQAIGYAEVVEHLSGTLPLDQAVARTVKRTRGLARRQLAWFRKDPRIRWFEAGEDGAGARSEEIAEYLTGG
jgi:tRNA dimethylallyltransferase